MKLLQIVPRDGTRLFGAMIKKQAEIRKSGRGTFSRAGARKRNAARWTHVRYKGSVDLEPGLSDTVEVAIKSPERGDEARLNRRGRISRSGYKSNPCSDQARNPA